MRSVALLSRGMKRMLGAHALSHSLKFPLFQPSEQLLSAQTRQLSFPKPSIPSFLFTFILTSSSHPSTLPPFSSSPTGGATLF